MARSRYTPRVLSRLWSEGVAPQTFIVLGAGQSNMRMWSESSVNYAGRDSFLATLEQYNPNGTNGFIQGANSGSFLSKRAYDCYNNFPGSTGPSNSDYPNDYWVDDTVTPFVAGPRLTEAFTAITTAGYATEDVTHILWSQGEADASEHWRTLYRPINPSYPSTIAEYWAALQWLVEYFQDNLPSLEQFRVRPLARKYNDSTLYGPVRQKQLLLETTYAGLCYYGSETYDLESTDGVHRTEAGFTIEGQRTAYELLASKGLFGGNTKGAYITGTTYDPLEKAITVTVAHDKGTNLKSAAGVVYSGTPIDCTPASGDTGLFILSDELGNSVAVSTVEIIGTNQIKITLDTELLAPNNTISFGNNNFYDLDLNCIIYDNASNSLPIRAAYEADCDGTDDMASIAALSGLVSLFTPENTYNAGWGSADAVRWTKRAGSGSSARRDDSKPVPFHSHDISEVYSGAEPIPGWVFQGVPSQKLLVEHALTTSDDFTLFVSFTCDDTVADLVTSIHNSVIATSTMPGTGQSPVFMVRQISTNLQSTQGYSGDAGETSDVTAGVATPQVVGIRKSGASVTYWNASAEEATRTQTTITAPDIDGSANVFAIGNIPLHGSGTSDLDTTFKGAIHHIVLVNRALSNSDSAAIRGIINKDLVDLRNSQSAESSETSESVILSTSPAVWMDAQHVASLTLNGDLVSTQASRVNSLSATQATAANQPKLLSSGINHRPALQFYHSGAASSLVMNDNAVMDWAGGDLFHMLVFTRDSDSGAVESLVSKFATSGNQREWSLTVNSIDRFGMSCSPDGATSSGSSVTTTIPISKPILATAWRQSSDGKMYTKFDTNAGRYEQLTGVTLSAVFNGTSPISYGTRAGALTEPFIGREGEHLMFTAKPTAAQESDLLVAMYRNWRIR